MPNQANLNLDTHNPAELIQILKQGLSVEMFNQMAERLQVSEKRLAATVNIAVSTLTRRKHEGRLTAGESDRLYRMIRVFNRAVEVLDSEDDTKRWFHTKVKGIGWETPFSYMDTEVGAREVEAVLGRLEHGVIS
jgi:putative toxin-antitoxin system antitoxin component (TIGR02293 family)